MMRVMLFPSQYKKTLLSGKKNSTIRVGEEIGKYKAGNVYSAMSYAGREWDVKVKISSVNLIRIRELCDFGIPKISVDATCRKEGLGLNDKVELIKFDIV